MVVVDGDGVGGDAGSVVADGCGGGFVVSGGGGWWCCCCAPLMGLLLVGCGVDSYCDCCCCNIYISLPFPLPPPPPPTSLPLRLSLSLRMSARPIAMLFGSATRKGSPRADAPGGSSGNGGTPARRYRKAPGRRPCPSEKNGNEPQRPRTGMVPDGAKMQGDRSFWGTSWSLLALR